MLERYLCDEFKGALTAIATNRTFFRSGSDQASFARKLLLLEEDVVLDDLFSILKPVYQVTCILQTEGLTVLQAQDAIT